MQTILITGATGNLGGAVRETFLKNNFRVIGTVHHKPSSESGSDNESLIQLDLTEEKQCEDFVSGLITNYSKLDVAVLTAGGFDQGNIESTSYTAIEKQLALNFKTAYTVVRPVFLQMLKQNSGRIFLIGSQPGLTIQKGKNMVAYALSKSLIFQLADLLNAEAAGKNVVVSVVVPSTIDTPENRKSMPDADFSAWQTPQEIAEIIHFYCTKTASNLRKPIIQF